VTPSGRRSTGKRGGKRRARKLGRTTTDPAAKTFKRPGVEGTK
jgi:hypothetical protein